MRGQHVIYAIRLWTCLSLCQRDAERMLAELCHAKHFSFTFEYK